MMRSSEVAACGHRFLSQGIAAVNDSDSPRPARRILPATTSPAATSPAATRSSATLAIPGRSVPDAAPANGVPSPTRRRLLRGLSAALALGSLGMHAALRTSPVHAEEEDGGAAPAGSDASATSQPAPNVHVFSLSSKAEGPLAESVSLSKEKAELGWSRFEDGTYTMHLNDWRPGLRTSEWMNRRIGRFSFRDGAVMVEAKGELSPTGCFALEMRHQAYKDHRYIRSNWLCMDPYDGHCHIQTDGIWNEMEIVADHHGETTPLRPPGEWNSFLFMADGDYLEGWVNGEQAVAGHDGRWGSGNLSLIAMRIDKQAFRVRFKNLRVWEGHWPGPTSVW